MSRKKRGSSSRRRLTKRKVRSSKPLFDVDDKLRTAIQYHQSGQLQKAWRMCAKVVQIDPNHPVALHLLGVIAHQNGKTDMAIDLMTRAIQNDPDNPICHNDLGNALDDQGKLDEAISCFQKALQLKPEFTDAYNNMAIAFQRQGKLDEAISCLQKALKLEPDFAGAYNNMGIAYKDRGDLGEAISCYEKALELEPGLVEAYNNMGIAYRDQGKLHEAVSCYEKAVQWKPDFAEAYNNMGIAYRDQGKLHEAVSCYEKAVQWKPDLAGAYNNLGMALNEMGKHQEAITCHNKAIELAPDFAEAHNSLGIALNDVGKYEEAIACYKRAIGIKADFVPAVSSLASLFEQTNRIHDAWETAVKALRQDESDPTANLVAARCERRAGKYESALSRLEKIDLKVPTSSIRASILNEKGTLYDRLGAYDEAFECFAQANVVIAQTWNARQINRSLYVDAISWLTSYFQDAEPGLWSSSEEFAEGLHPVFLVGFPRSGTTLLEQILGAHPDIRTLDEKPLVNAMIQRLNVHGLRYPDELDQVNFDLVEDLRNTYFSKASEFLPNQYDGILIDKLPLNITEVGFIHRVFPHSKIIFALRHPCDVCLSCFIQNFKLNEAMAHFLDLEDTARLYDLVMALWAIYADRLSLNFHVIKYENLVTNFDKETRQLLCFLEMPWDLSVRNYASHAKSRGKISTPSYHQVSEAIYTHSMYRWKNYAKYLKPIFNILNSHIERFGYNLTTEL